MSALAHVSDAAIWWAGVWGLAGWLAGVAFAVVVCWSRIRRTPTPDAAIRLLRFQVDDDARHIRELYAANDRTTRKLVEAEARNAELLARLAAPVTVA